MTLALTAALLLAIVAMATCHPGARAMSHTIPPKFSAPSKTSGYRGDTLQRSWRATHLIAILSLALVDSDC